MTAGSYEALELRIKTILPELYQDSYEEVQPVSMGSAGLKYDGEGKVAWDDIWTTFCDLAMAGGPPHKGKLLEPATKEEIALQPERYKQVVEEICRGIGLVTELEAEAAEDPGWVRADCGSSVMAGWLVRAIVMENISVRCHGTLIDLPAGPDYRVEKEIKNVITVIAKTCHYWIEHMWMAQQKEIGDLFAKLAVETPLVQPAVVGDDFRADKDLALRGKMAVAIAEATGLRASDRFCAGWLGVECGTVKGAIWMMRALVASNVLARREETVLFVPVNPKTDPNGETVVQVLAQVHGFAAARGVFANV